jgi:hypothetical protein
MGSRHAASQYTYIGWSMASEMQKRKTVRLTEILVDSNRSTRTDIPEAWDLHQDRSANHKNRVNSTFPGRQIDWPLTV